MLLVLLLISTGSSFGQVSVTTFHNDSSRTGANLNETILNTSNVKTGQFGKLFSRSVDGIIWTQPLYVPNVSIPGQGLHNVVYVATEHNNVYAFDADDPAAGIPLWRVNLGPPVPPSPKDDTLGITATPVIDLSRNRLYVVAKTYEYGKIIFRLHALELTTGTHQSGPVAIQGSVRGTAPGNRDGVLSFDPAWVTQRAGLLLLDSNIYIAFAAYAESQPLYHGWIFVYNGATLNQVAILCVTPNAYGGGVWQAGSGLAADANSNIYFQTGNGVMDAHRSGANFGDSLVKAITKPGLGIVDYFSPSNQPDLEAADADFGSGGPLLIPGTSLGVTGGKDGKLFLFDTNNLGQFHDTNRVVQEWQATYSILTTGAGGIFGGNVYYNNTLYVWGRRDALKAFKFTGSSFDTTPASQSSFTITDGYSNEPGMSISANGAIRGTGILWAVVATEWDDNTYYGPGILYAFDAADLKKELWNSNLNKRRNYSGSYARWIPPTIANGKVYLATFDNLLNVYGLLPRGNLQIDTDSGERLE